MSVLRREVRPVAKKSREIHVNCSADHAFEYAQTAIYLTDRVVGEKNADQRTILAGRKASGVEQVERLSSAKLSVYERIRIGVRDDGESGEGHAIVAITAEAPRAFFDLTGSLNKYINRFEAELQIQVARHDSSGAPIVSS